MEGEDGIPVSAPEESAGPEGGRLDELVGGDFELKPGLAGHFHFSGENEPCGRLRVFLIGKDDAPEVERITGEKLGGVASAASDASASDEAVHPAAKPPSPVHRRPTFGAAERPDGCDGFLAVGGEWEGLLVREDAVGGHLHRLQERGIELAGGEGIEPRGRDLILGDADKGLVDGFVVGEEVLRDEFGESIVLADGFVDEGLDERFGKWVTGGSNEVKPACGESRRKKGNRNDEAFEITGGGVTEEEFAVGKNIRSSDVELFTESLRSAENSGEVADDVSDSDGLATVGRPLRGDHEGELFGEVTDDFEGS